MVIRGNNTFLFSSSTMMEIVQHYLNTVLLKEDAGVSVRDVEWSTNDKVFRVHVVSTDSLTEDSG